MRSLATFTSNEKAGVQDIAKIMLDDSNKYYEILAANTLQSMIFLPASGYLYLYTAPVFSANDTMGNTVRHPAYQVYYEDLIPSKLRKSRNGNHYFWWIVGLLTLLILALWWIRRSIKKAEVIS